MGKLVSLIIILHVANKFLCSSPAKPIKQRRFYCPRSLVERCSIQSNCRGQALHGAGTLLWKTCSPRFPFCFMNVREDFYPPRRNERSLWRSRFHKALDGILCCCCCCCCWSAPWLLGCCYCLLLKGRSRLKHADGKSRPCLSHQRRKKVG